MKALASILLLARYSLMFFIEACQNKLIVSLERLSRDKTKGTPEALTLAKREIKRRAPEMLHEARHWISQDKSIRDIGHVLMDL